MSLLGFLANSFLGAAVGGGPIIENPFGRTTMNLVGKAIEGIVMDSTINTTRAVLNEMKKPVYEKPTIVGYEQKPHLVPPMNNPDNGIFNWNDPSMWKMEYTSVPVYNKGNKTITTNNQMLDETISAFGTGLLDYAGNITGIDMGYKDNFSDRLSRIDSIMRR